MNMIAPQGVGFFIFFQEEAAAKKDRRKILTLPDGKNVEVSGAREAQSILNRYYAKDDKKAPKIKIKAVTIQATNEIIHRYTLPGNKISKTINNPLKLYPKYEIEQALKEAARRKRMKHDEEAILLLI